MKPKLLFLLVLLGLASGLLVTGCGDAGEQPPGPQPATNTPAAATNPPTVR